MQTDILVSAVLWNIHSTQKERERYDLFFLSNCFVTHLNAQISTLSTDIHQNFVYISYCTNTRGYLILVFKWSDIKVTLSWLNINDLDGILTPTDLSPSFAALAI